MEARARRQRAVLASKAGFDGERKTGTGEGAVRLGARRDRVRTPWDLTGFAIHASDRKLQGVREQGAELSFCVGGMFG